MPQNKVIIVAGPTASGKSALAIDIASYFNGVVLNADSMQVYKNMPIITAAPTPSDKQKVDHRLFEIFEPSFRGNVADWLKLAAREIRNVWAEQKLPVVVGGTGLYIENLMKGTTPIPEIKDEIRQKVQNMIESEGAPFVHAKLRDVDPVSFQKLNANDSSRIKRAYEVYLGTKKPLSYWQKQEMLHYLPEADFFVIKICPSVQELDALAFNRFDKMVERGAIDEVKTLCSQNLDLNLPAMKALGVPELAAFCKGEVDMKTAIQNAKLHTRQYAKRQRTWFNNRLKADYVFNKCYRTPLPSDLLALLGA